MSIYAKLADIQAKIKVEKSQYNKFGGYKYRSKEDILEAAKPLCAGHGLALVCNDEPVVIADGWVYIKASAALIDTESGESVSAMGWAREPQEKKGMDASQITGTAASYAGKRALGNLLAIDDTKDADVSQAADGPFIAACTACGARYQFESDEHMTQCACTCGNTSFARE